MAPKSSPRAIAKVIYKPSTQSTDEYTVVVNVDEYNRWKAGAFRVLFSNQGSQGILRAPSEQQLENEFGTKKDIDVVQQILEKGNFKESDGIRNASVGGPNLTKGSAIVDTRGKRTMNGI
ncbi:hypothetical protein EIP86_003956 [Pleurotus ostreatoroseus]|nr:hypothetical protein EIP86_003956 [Pleurotus ostreatoroseus]